MNFYSFDSWPRRSNIFFFSLQEDNCLTSYFLDSKFPISRQGLSLSMAGLHWNHSFYPTRLIFPRGERMEMRERSASIHACFTCARGHRRNSDCIIIYDRQGNPLPHNDHRSLCNVRIKWAGLANCRISQLAEWTRLDRTMNRGCSPLRLVSSPSDF